MAKTKHFGALAAAAGTLVAVALLVLMLVLVNPQTAEAAFPGTNGRIAYSSWDGNDWEIFAIDPDTGGAQGQQLTSNNTTDVNPCYSPDGNTIGYVGRAAANTPQQIFKIPATGGTPVQVTPNTAVPIDCNFTGPKGTHIVYSGLASSALFDLEIFTIPATGGTPFQVTNDFGSEDFSPAFTAVGQRVAYVGRDRTGAGFDFEIFTIPVNGGTPTQLTFNSVSDADPDYRPDGGRIVYSSRELGPIGNQLDLEIFTMPATGGTRTQLTFNDTLDTEPVYSPDGQQIAYESFHGRSGTTPADDEIFTMPATGGQPVQVTFNTEPDRTPSWQPRR